MKNNRQETQVEMVLNHLMRGNAITPIEALNQYGCFRLSAIIYNIRKLGINVVSENVRIHDKNFASYSLGQEELNIIKQTKGINTSKDYIQLMINY